MRIPILVALPSLFLAASSVTADTRSFTSNRPPSVSKIITAPSVDTVIPSSTIAEHRPGPEKREVVPAASASVATGAPVEPEPEQEAEVFPPPNAGE